MARSVHCDSSQGEEEWDDYAAVYKHPWAKDLKNALPSDASPAINNYLGQAGINKGAIQVNICFANVHPRPETGRVCTRGA